MTTLSHTNSPPQGKTRRRRNPAARCHSPRIATAFTLIEVIIIMMILGIFATLVIPHAGSATQSQLPAAMRILEADLAYAQSYNITHQHAPCAVVFNPAGDGYRLAPLSSPDLPLTHPGDKQPYSMTFGVGRGSMLGTIRIKSHTAGVDNRLGFGSLGQLDQSAAATITLTDGTRDMAITLNPITGLGAITWP